MKTIVIRTYYSSPEAHLAKHQIENEEIYCFLENETISNMLPGYSGMFNSGIKLRVDSEYSDKAIKILKESEVLQCPKCLSAKIKVNSKRRSENWFLAIIGFVAMSPIGKLNSYWECEECKHQF